MPGILLRLRSPVVRTVFKCLVSRIRLARERALAGVRGAPGEGIPAGEGAVVRVGALLGEGALVRVRGAAGEGILPGEGALPGV